MNARRLLRLFRPRNFLYLLLAFLLLDALFPLPAPKPWSQIVYARDGQPVQAWLSPDDAWRLRSRPEDMPPQLIQALLAKEDRWFWHHPGVNPLAILRAAWGNVVTGKRGSGASTLTMQVARRMEPRPRTLWSKVQESFRALQLEWHYSKHDILEMYLSYLPYGGNVEGVAAASWLYLGKAPRELSLAECALLTVIPNRPNSLRPDRNLEAAQAMRDKWLRRFAADGTFAAPLVQAALAEPMQAQRRDFVSIAPQYAVRVREQVPGDRIHSTLNPVMQAGVQRLLQGHVRGLAAKAITNGAVLVVDNRTREVLVWCGSADFTDSLHQGQVDAVNAVRSPGSALKPAIYAAAMDRGLCTPLSPLLDIPSGWQGFTPVNYDHTFQGRVSMRYALEHSLNVPAVRSLHAVGLHPFVEMLVQARFEAVATQRQDLGLSLALGGCGVRLEELVGLYAALANGGMWKPLRLHANAPAGDSVRLFSPEAAWLTADMLEGLARPDVPNGLLSRTQRARIAWKTGTSFGRRDAWAIGFNPRYTVGVWIGNMDGRGSVHLSGAAVAVPLLFGVFEALPAGPAGKGDWFPRPAGLERRHICLESGRIAASGCTSVGLDWGIRGVSPALRCDRSRTLYTNAAGTLQYCTVCLPETGFVQRQVHPEAPELLGWRMAQNPGAGTALPHNPACTAVFHGKGLQITAPKAGVELITTAETPVTFQTLPDPGVSQCWWYADGQFLGTSRPGVALSADLSSGPHEILCLDDRGRSSRMQFQLTEF